MPPEGYYERHVEHFMCRCDVIPATYSPVDEAEAILRDASP